MKTNQNGGNPTESAPAENSGFNPDNMVLSITRLSDTGGKYGHDDKSYTYYLELLESVKNFLRGKKIKPQYNNIKGIHVSNSGCNISLMILQPYHSGVTGRHNDSVIHYHSIYTTQNDQIVKFGFPPRNTCLNRFVETI
jgi:hypothetical protein